MKKKKLLFILSVTLILSITLYIAFFSRCSIKEIKYIGYGANKTVSGSMHILEMDNLKIMLDAGSFYGRDGQEEKRYNESLIKGLSTIIISHAHIDHIGNLAKIVNMGYSGNILCSEPTKELMPTMLRMTSRYGCFGEETFYLSKSNQKKEKNIAVHIYKDCKYCKKIKKYNIETIKISRDELAKNGFHICNECANLEISNIMDKVQTIPLNQKYSIGIYTDIEFFNTPHLPGAVMVKLYDKKLNKTLLYTGDVGSGLSPFLAPQQYVNDTDYAIIEGTYGTKAFKNTLHDRLEFQKKIGNYIKSGKRVIIPAFVLDRSQQVLHELSKAKQLNIIPPKTPIKVIGNSVLEINHIYKDILTYDKNSLYFSRNYKIEGPFSSNFNELKTIQNNDDIKHGEIAIVSSGMANESNAKEFVEKWISDPNTVFIFVGYQDPETIGGKLTVSNNNKLVINGVEREIKAKIEKFECFSGHGDINQISDIISKANGIKEILIVHLNDYDANNLKKEYETRFPNIKFYVPEYIKEHTFSK